ARARAAARGAPAARRRPQRAAGALAGSAAGGVGADAVRGARHRSPAAARGRRLRCDGRAARRLGGAGRHLAGRRPAVDAAAGGLGGRPAGRPALRDRAGRHRRAAQPGGGVPPVLPRARRRRLDGVPDRRPVQPVRGVRGHARRVVRPDHAGRRRGAGAGRHDLRRHQPGRLGAVRDGRRARLRRDRHGQHGRRRRPAAGRAGRRARRPRAHPAGRLRHQGGHLPAVLLAARQLPHGALAGHRGVRRPAHQGRGLRDPAHADAAVPGLAGHRPGAARHRDPDDGRGHPRRPRAGRPQAAAVVHDREPHRLHAAGARARVHRRPRRRGDLHRPPHRRADHAVPRRRAGRAARGHRVAAPVGRPAARRAPARRALPAAGALARRDPAAVGLRGQARAAAGRARRRRRAGAHRRGSRGAHQPADAVRRGPRLQRGVLGTGRRRRRRRRPHRPGRRRHGQHPWPHARSGRRRGRGGARDHRRRRPAVRPVGAGRRGPRLARRLRQRGPGRCAV
ncbi:MAG: Na(+) H(+) antiporter subunit D, partial [uncultured Frankineae bacterium]